MQVLVVTGRGRKAQRREIFIEELRVKNETRTYLRGETIVLRPEFRSPQRGAKSHGKPKHYK